MKRRTTFCLLAFLVPAISLGAMFVAKRRNAVCRQPTPAIEFPISIAMGERELGKIASTQFRIANRGDAELVIENIRTNCSCSGLEQKVNGVFVRLQVLKLAPGEETELHLRVSVHGHAGAAMQNVIQFETNDPAMPEAQILATVSRITGGIAAYPSAAWFGVVRVGTAPVAKRIDLHDHAALARSVVAVTSSDPEQFTVKWLPCKDDEANSSPGFRLGQIEVSLKPKRIGTLEGRILVQLAEEPEASLVLPVSAKISHPVEAYPSRLLFPRSSSQGALYQTECLCIATEGKTFTLAPKSVPRGIRITVSNDEVNASHRTVKMEMSPSEFAAEKGQHRDTVQLLAHIAGEGDSIVEIPIEYRKPGE